jgi:hypothetical protein
MKKTIAQRASLRTESFDEDMKKKNNLVAGELKDLEVLRGSGSKNEGKGLSMAERFGRWGEEARCSLEVVKSHPHILVIPFLIFAALCGSGLALILLLAKDQEEDIKEEAMALAIETGNWFCKYTSGASIDDSSYSAVSNLAFNLNSRSVGFGYSPSLLHGSVRHRTCHFQGYAR